MNPATTLSPVTGLGSRSPAWLRFVLLCTLFLLAALWLEPLLSPLCRATASQAGVLLSLAGSAPQVQGDMITLPGFSVRIVIECTPLYACLLYGAFVLSQPASWRRTLAGLSTGAMVIIAANLLRIATVTVAGATRPELFEILHVYLGQVAMLILVVAAAMVWLRWSAGGPAPFPFLLRAIFYATVLFVPWVAVNLSYVELLDNLVALLFSQLFPGYRLLTPRPFAIYNHTFAVPLLLALVMAGRSAWSWRRLAATAGGVCAIAAWHALFRVTHVVWTALDVPEVAPLHQAIYLVSQFLLPFMIWLLLDGRTSRRGRGAPALPAQTAILSLLLILCWSSAAPAEPGVSAYPNGRGAFNIMGNKLNRVTEAEIRVDYQSDDQTPPLVNGAGLGAQAAVAVQADNPGSLTIRLKSGKPMSGDVQLATAWILGTITGISAWTRDEKGATETASASITNPTDEQLKEMAARWPAAKAAAAARPAPKPAPVGAPATAPAAVSIPQPAASPEAARAAEPDQAPRNAAIQYSRRKSVMELFLAPTGDRSPAALARLFERNDSMFLQEPPALLSDGVAALRLTVRVAGNNEKAPLFFISGGNCIGLEAGDDGAWVLQIVPERGSLASSVTVLTWQEMIEYPLAVAPPLELFDTAGAPAGEVEYVSTANRLASGKHESK